MERFLNSLPTWISQCPGPKNCPSYPEIYGDESYCARPAAAIMVSLVVERSLPRPARTETTTIIKTITINQFLL